MQKNTAAKDEEKYIYIDTYIHTNITDQTIFHESNSTKQASIDEGCLKGRGRLEVDKLHWLNVPERVAFKLSLMVFNCLHNQAPQYLVDLCQSVSSVASRQHLRSASRGLLVVPRHRLSSYGRRAFSVAGSAIWNWLSDSLRDLAISRDSFKRSLKTFLFSAYSCT